MNYVQRSIVSSGRDRQQDEVKNESKNQIRFLGSFIQSSDESQEYISISKPTIDDNNRE